MQCVERRGAPRKGCRVALLSAEFLDLSPCVWGEAGVFLQKRHPSDGLLAYGKGRRAEWVGVGTSQKAVMEGAGEGRGVRGVAVDL